MQHKAEFSSQVLDPRELILDENLQGRDPMLILSMKDREAQIRKQESQDRDILEDLENGLEIRVPITVYEVAYSDLLEHSFRFYLNTSDQRIVG